MHSRCLESCVHEYTLNLHVLTCNKVTALLVLQLPNFEAERQAMGEVLGIDLFRDRDRAWQMMHNLTTFITDKDTVNNTVRGKDYIV